MIALGECDIAVSGGAESMSRAPHVMTGARWGTKMGNLVAVDAMLTALSDPLEKIHMGVPAENVARKYSLTRAMQDQLAVQRHPRAARAQEEARSKRQTLPLELQHRTAVPVVETDAPVNEEPALTAQA